MRTLYRIVTSTNLILSGLFIILAFNLPEIILRFLLVGELPDGTTLLSPDVMLVLILIGFLVTALLVYPSIATKTIGKFIQTSSTKLRLPKHRYTSL